MPAHHPEETVPAYNIPGGLLQLRPQHMPKWTDPPVGSVSVQMSLNDTDNPTEHLQAAG